MSARDMANGLLRDFATAQLAGRPAHSLITAAARDDHGRPMLRASCSCGWVSGNRWYHEMFVVQDHEAHVRQEGK